MCSCFCYDIAKSLKVNLLLLSLAAFNYFWGDMIWGKRVWGITYYSRTERLFFHKCI